MSNIRYERAYQIFINGTKVDIADGSLKETEVITKNAITQLNFKLKYVIDGDNSKDTTYCVIYNLPQDTIDSIKESDKSTIEIFAGYTNDARLNLIYFGDIITMETSKQGADQSTTFLCSSGEIVKRKAMCNITANKGQPIKEVLKSISSTFGLPVDVSKFTSTKSVQQKSRPFHGITKNILDKLSVEFKFKWYIENNIVQILDANSSANNVILTHNITPDLVRDTLKNSTDITAKKTGTDLKSTNIQGITITTRLISGASLSDKVSLSGFESYGFKDTEFSIKSIKQVLDYWGDGRWETTMELIPYVSK